MLTLFRKFARSWVSVIIIGLLVISFGVFGMQDTFSGIAADSVAKVAKKGISQNEFRAEFDRQLKRAKEENKRDISIEEARKGGLDNAVLEQMVEDRAYAAMTNKLGLIVSNTVIQAEIAKIPGFQNPGTGSFSETAYQEALSLNGFSVPEFETTVRRDLAKQALTLAASSGFRAPRVFASQTLAFGTERRVVTVVPIAAGLAGPPRQPSEAQIAAFYQENKEALTRPETRALTLVIASLSDFEAKATADEAQVRQIFDRNKARLLTRSLVQISAPDKAKADQAAARLRAGEAPEAIATALGLGAPIVYTDKSQAAVSDENVGRAAFAAANGAVEVVAAKLQPFAAVKVTAINEPSFNEQAPAIRAQLRKAAAGEKLTDATEAFDKAISGGGTIEAAATASGFKIVKVPGVVADGRAIANGQPLPELAAAPGILRDAFAGSKGEIGDLAQLPPVEGQPSNAYMTYRIDNITPASAPPMNEIRPQLVGEWLRRDVGTRLKARADEILAEAKRTTLEAAATKFNLPIMRQAAPLQRGQGGPGLSQAVFAAKKGDVLSVQTANGVEYAIIRIEDILRDDDATVPERMTQAETAVRETVQRDIVSSLQRVARERARAQLYPEMMGRALGDTAETIAAAAAAASKTPAKPKTP